MAASSTGPSLPAMTLPAQLTPFHVPPDLAQALEEVLEEATREEAQRCAFLVVDAAMTNPSEAIQKELLRVAQQIRVGTAAPPKRTGAHQR